MDQNIIAILRIKNEERWIKKCLDAASEIVSGFVILDDGSTDSTTSICKKFSNVLELYEQSDLPFDEVRDKNMLLKIALKYNPDLILSLDGDEIIQPNAKNILFEEINVIYPDAPVFEFQSLFVWDKPNQYRFDGVYGNIWYKRLLRLKNQPLNISYEPTGYPGNAHSTRLPSNCIGWNNPVRSKIKILHYGYYDEELRKTKYDFYTKLDPNNINFDGYRHIIGGGKFSGPSGISLNLIPSVCVQDIK